MNFRNLFESRSTRIYFIVSVSVGLVYILLRLIIFDANPFLPLLDSLYKAYLFLPECIANLIFKSLDAGVFIKNHHLIFENTAAYHLDYREFIENWPKFLLYKRFSALVLVVMWITFSPLRKKILFSFLFLITHLISVVGGLYLLGVALPEIIDEQTNFFVSPTLVGTLTMFILLLTWVLFNKREIRNTFQKIDINFAISDRRIHEILVLLLFFLILRNYIIPFVAFKPYVIFLLEITSRIASIFNYDGYISGDQLIGENGALALSKHCLGFMTMYLFAAMVYLTRPVNINGITGVYILSGLFFIFILNLVRLILVFIIAQGENGFQRASIHHEAYNVGIYIVIFVLWVIWFELIRRLGISRKDTKIETK